MAGTVERVSIKGRQKMGKKHIEINIVKNPQDQKSIRLLKLLKPILIIPIKNLRPVTSGVTNVYNILLALRHKLLTRRCGCTVDFPFHHKLD
jgi:hypothetical protein